MGAVSSTFSQLWRVLNGTRKIIVNLVFFLVLALIIIALTSEEEPIVVPDNAILVLNPQGVIVEEKTYVDPVEAFFEETFGGQPENPEVLLSDILESIQRAQADDSIGALLLNLENLRGGGVNKLQAIGAALDEFRQSGKPIIAVGDYYSQSQYYLAAHADKVYLNPLGGVDLQGFGYYQLYFKDMLAKLKVNSHVFKAGAYKSAVEPYTRNDMSDEAREANSELYMALWDAFKDDLTAHRAIEPRLLQGDLEDFMALYEAADADSAAFAMQTKLVDALKTREEIRTELINLSGFDEEKESYKNISFLSYLEATNDAPQLVGSSKPTIALIHARGVIMDGYHKPGIVGGDSTAELLRNARLNENTKAVVLRIDSPGGSGFASEIIRQEVLQLQQAGIPVVASMSTVAASGGYWIAASADEIWAAPTTITGSIGVFGMFFTLEDSLAELGINSDGFRTTEYPQLNPTRELSDSAKQLVQSNIEKFYEDFVSLVAESREMSFDAVHEVAQGRVWTGSKAQELGLVDSLGNLNDAVLAAARLAELDDYRVAPVEPELSAKEMFFKELFGKAAVWLPEPAQQPQRGLVKQSIYRVWREVEMLDKFNDPQGIYALCELCPTD